MTDGADILIAEDEYAIREALDTLFASEGYRVRTAPDGEAALAAYRAKRPDVLLLDVRMPRLNGYAVCRAVRETDKTTPVLFLTACAADADQLRGFGLGADDWIVKTVSDVVLLARVAAALRRVATEDTGDFAFGACRVDARRQTVSVEGVETRVTAREIALLRHFAAHPGEVFSVDALLTRFWGTGFEGTDATLRVAMTRLRRKLGAVGGALRSIRGEGYVYAVEDRGKEP